jgi:hypothetical protein
MMAKRTIEMAIRVGTAVTNRRMMYFPIALRVLPAIVLTARTLAARRQSVIEP